MNVVVIIPTIDPDERIVSLVCQLQKRGLSRFVIVNDGSAPKCDELFAELERLGACVLHHAINLGKGAAIKTGLAAVRKLFPEATHVVTVDGDGQHLPDDVVRVCRAADGHHDHVVIGIRDLNSRDVPARSRLGNSFSSAYFKFDTGVSCPDTQTGLRAFPLSLAQFALSIPGMRYEYEMNFLTTVVKRNIPLAMVPIATVYEDNNATSHFLAVKDSVRIYSELVRFAGSSLACSAVDLGLFALFTTLFNLETALLVTLATVIARMASGLVNFSLNRRWSFSETGSVRGDRRTQGLRYALLFFAQMLASAGLVTICSAAPLPLVAIKVVVDSTLFAISYFVQRNWVFKTAPHSNAMLVKGADYGNNASRPYRTV